MSSGKTFDNLLNRKPDGKRLNEALSPAQKKLINFIDKEYNNDLESFLEQLGRLSYQLSKEYKALAADPDTDDEIKSDCDDNSRYFATLAPQLAKAAKTAKYCDMVGPGYW